MQQAELLHVGFGEAPALAAVERDGEDQALVDGALGSVCDDAGGEEAAMQRAESLAARLHTRRHRCGVATITRDDVAQVGEAVNDRHAHAVGQLDVGTHTFDGADLSICTYAVVIC